MGSTGPNHAEISKPRNIPIEVVEQALLNSGGFQTNAAKQLGISPAAVCQRVSNSPRLQKVLEGIKSKYLDLAEYKLIKLVESGNFSAVCFYLKCQGKNRGYVETQRLEHSGRDGGPITVVGAGYPGTKNAAKNDG